MLGSDSEISKTGRELREGRGMDERGGKRRGREGKEGEGMFDPRAKI